MLHRVITNHIDGIFMTAALAVSVLGYIVLITNINSILR
jgi:hypothetical protein